MQGSVGCADSLRYLVKQKQNTRWGTANPTACRSFVSPQRLLCLGIWCSNEERSKLEVVEGSEDLMTRWIWPSMRRSFYGLTMPSDRFVFCRGFFFTARLESEFPVATVGWLWPLATVSGFSKVSLSLAWGFILALQIRWGNHGSCGLHKSLILLWYCARL